MLDHLADPEPFDPSPGFRPGIERRARLLRTRRRLISSATALAVVAGFVGSGLAYVERRDAAIDRIEVSASPSSDEATNVLVVGADAAPAVEGARADTILIVRFEPDRSVRALFISRDLWDPRAGERLATAAGSGTQALIDSVVGVTGVPVDHFISFDLAGFVRLVEDLGGLDLALDTDIRDAPTGLELPGSGCLALSGDTALALVRARHLEYKDETGQWQLDPTGDLGRMARAQAVMSVSLTTLASAGADPIAIDRFSRLLADHATIDADLGLTRLAALGYQLATAGTAATAMETLPVEPVVTDGGANVMGLAAGAGPLLESYGAPGADTVSPVPTTAPGASIAPIRPC